MSYQGLKTISQEDYIFEDVMPYIPEFNIDELKRIESKLKNYTSGQDINGLTPQEAETFLDWITFNARKYAISGKDTPEFMAIDAIPTDPMTGQCAPTQKFNVELLKKFGLEARPFNTADCIGQIPISEESRRRMENGFASPAVRHSVSVVTIPIIDDNGKTNEYKYLLDPTFRQFFLKDSCDESKFYDEYELTHMHVAPHPGYFMKEDNLIQLGVSKESAQRIESLGKFIISKGYVHLSEENAKMYADTFRRASINKEYQHLASENVRGEKYIWNFENIPMQMTTLSRGDRFLKLPSEIEQKKQGIFTRIKNFFNGIFGRKQEMLPRGNVDINNGIEIPSRPKIERAVLTTEQYSKFKEKESEILNSYNNRDNDSKVIISSEDKQL